MQKILHIDPERCKSCGLCIQSCPKQCLVQTNHRNAAGYQSVGFAPGAHCIGCGTCTLVCPEPMALTLCEGSPVDSDDPKVLLNEVPLENTDGNLSSILPEELTHTLLDDAADSITQKLKQQLTEILTERVTQAILELRQNENATPLRAFLKGNDAVICAAIYAGCRAFFGYPITPASEISHDAMLMLPKAGAEAIQAESEVSAINMLYGAGSAGVRAMTATSGPGFSLMQEGISYMAAARLPGVIVDVMRSGPGLGNIGPEQGDYFMATRGGGHGHYHTPVLAPASVSEMFTLTCQAFNIAMKYRTPVIVLADAFIGQAMETVELPTSFSPISKTENADWAAKPEFSPNVISSLELDPTKLERLDDDRFEIYAQMQTELPEACCTHVASPKLLCVAFGICARIAADAQKQSESFDLFRPISLWPFPERQLIEAAQSINTILVVECNRGQMLDDIRRLLPDKTILFIGHDGGVIPQTQEILNIVNSL